MDEDAIAALLRDSPEAGASRPADTVVDGLTAVDVPGQPVERSPYRPGGKPGEEKAPANTSDAARELLEKYKLRRRTKERSAE